MHQVNPAVVPDAPIARHKSKIHRSRFDRPVQRKKSTLQTVEPPSADIVTEGPSPDGSRGRRWLIIIGALALMAAMAAHLSDRGEDVAAVLRLSPRILLVALVCQLVAQLFWNGAMLQPLRPFMERLGFWELFMVRTGGFVAGYAVPVAGNLGVRVAYLRQRGLTYSEFTWATIVSNVLALLSGALMAVFALVLLWASAGPPPAAVWGLTLGLLAVGMVAVAALGLLPRFAGHSRFRKWGWLSRLSGFSTSPRATASTLVLSCLRQCFNFMTFGLLFQSLSPVPVQFVAGGLVYAITSPVRVVAITPGNIGVNEWVVAIVGQALSVDLATGLIVALVFRGVSLVAHVLGVAIAAAWLALWGV
jgi:uncharacterized membrane protein YbhN (UPF0104 family)